MKIRIYANLMEPRENPDYNRRGVKPPDWECFGNRTEFVALRSFPVMDGRIYDYSKYLDKYTVEHELAEVIWPSYPILFADNICELVEEIRKRKLFLFDIWGYVPGSGEGGYWRQYHPDKRVLEQIEAELGKHWLGMDVGEQDGRYVLAYVSQMAHPSADKVRQYLHFQEHIQKICDELGNKMVTLLAITLGHNELKEGSYTMIGAETAQMHPNAQVFYSYLRGAGKQYGVPWFGNASVYNRWGHKTYHMKDITTDEKDADYGPTKGTSLSLMKRLIYSHILYNCMIVGFESGWFEGEVTTDENGKLKVIESDKLSPIGYIQQSARKFVHEFGQPGTMITQVAIMNDFFSGWTFPNYNYQLYRVWGNRPYEACDYFADGVFDMFYPGYQNSSFFHDETGFITPTPYGDIVDCILSDAEQWLMDRYPILVVTGELSADEEIRDKLNEYARKGGHLVITAANLAKFSEGIAGFRSVGSVGIYPAGIKLTVEKGDITEENPFELYDLKSPEKARILVSCGDRPAVAESSYGQGKVTVIASPYGTCSESAVSLPVKCCVDIPLPRPYPLLKYVKYILDGIFSSQMLFSAGEELSLIICRKEKGSYTLGVCNNSWEEKVLRIESKIGKINSIKEVVLDQSEKTSVGYLPEGFENRSIGQNNRNRIAGGDVRIFQLETEESEVEEIEHVTPFFRQEGMSMILDGIYSVKEEILKMPTYFGHFDSIVLDWKYFHRSERSWLKTEGMWISRQGLKVIADLSSGLDLYPNLRLVNNDEKEYEEGMAVIYDILEKVELLGAKDMILCLHRAPENNFTRKQTEDSFVSSVRRICDKAAGLGITLHLRTKCADPDTIGLKNLKKVETDFHDMGLSELLQFIQKVGRKNLKVAAGTALLFAAEDRMDDLIAEIGKHIGLCLLAAPEKDVTGRIWSINSPLAVLKDTEKLYELLSKMTEVPIVLDTIYPDWNAAYRDVRLVEEIKRSMAEK